MTYEIRANEQYNSQEVYFSGKPSVPVRSALKGLKMRWNPQKSCWYGFADAETIEKALESVYPCEAVATDIPESKTINKGTIYEGWEGGNNKKWSTDKELKYFLSADFKRAGIKASIRQNRAGYLTSITVTVTVRADEIKTFEQWKESGSYDIRAGDWLYYKDESGSIKDIYGERFFALDPNAPGTISLRENIIRTAYDLRLSRLGSAGYSFTSYDDILQPTALARVETVKAIVASYNRDESNSMIDYFNRSIYDEYRVKVA